MLWPTDQVKTRKSSAEGTPGPGCSSLRVRSSHLGCPKGGQEVNPQSSDATSLQRFVFMDKLK